MRNTIVGMGLSLLLAGATADAHAAGSSQGQGPAVTKKAHQLSLFVQATPQMPMAPGPAKQNRLQLQAVLLLVDNDSIIIERQVDPAVIRAWLQAGAVQNGANGYANITHMVATETSILERVRFHGATKDSIEAMKRHQYRTCIMSVQYDANGHKFLDWIKPAP